MKEKVWLLNHYAGGMFYAKGGRHYNFAKYLKKNGYNPVVFCSNSMHNKPSCYNNLNSVWIEQVAEEIQVPWIFVHARAYTNNGKDRVLNMIDFYRNVQKAAKAYAKLNGKPDVILASSVHPLTLVAGIKLAKYFGVKCICEIRDLWPEAIFAYNPKRQNTLVGKMLVAGEHWIYKKADALIFTKEGDTDYIKEHNWDIAHGGDIDLAKTHYINNGIDLEVFDQMILQNTLLDSDLQKDCFNVVYAGTIRPVNAVGNILDTAKMLQKYPEIQFLIYGDGIDLPHLQERIQNENITNVKLKGRVDKNHIPFILSRSNVNLLNYSSKQYNWSRGNSSNKLFEYMASGRPVISTVEMGYSIIKRYGCGYEIPDNNIEMIAETIIKIKNMPSDDYSLLCQRARSGAKDFDFKLHTKKLINVIEKL